MIFVSGSHASYGDNLWNENENYAGYRADSLATQITQTKHGH